MLWDGGGDAVDEDDVDDNCDEEGDCVGDDDSGVYGDGGDVDDGSEGECRVGGAVANDGCLWWR